MWHNPVTSVDISGYFQLCSACVDSSGRISSFSDDCSGDTKVYKSIKRDLTELVYSLAVNYTPGEGTSSSSSSSSSSGSYPAAYSVTNDSMQYGVIYESTLVYTGIGYWNGASVVTDGATLPYWHNATYGYYLIWSAPYAMWTLIGNYYGTPYIYTVGSNTGSLPVESNQYAFEYDFNDLVTVTQINI